MSRFYIILLGVTALVVASTSAFFSVVGLAQLFAGASTAVIIMASALELAKIASAGFLYRYWGHINGPIRVYLLGAVSVLVVITSMGIYGFLANAYQVSSFAWKTDLMRIEALKKEDARLEAQIGEFRAFVDAIPANRISRKYEFQKIYDPQIKDIQTRQAKIQKDVAAMQVELYSKQTKIGPVTYLADAIGVEVDTVVKVLILLFVLVFDPLAVCLIFCWNLVVRLREKYRGDENKIAAHPLMGKLVDHRFKKTHLRKAG